MNSNKKVKILLAFLYLFIALITTPNHIFPANSSVGSNTRLRAQAHRTFSGFNNQIRRGAIMDAGFTFVDENTTCSWYSLFPAKGNIDLNGGRLSLYRDIEFDDDFDFISPAKIYGNNYTLLPKF